MEKAKLRLLAALCLLFAGVVLYAQQGTIVLRNASFEDQPSHSKTPKEWIDCGFTGESEPDIQPSGHFGVTMRPFDGFTYLGMVVRDNETWERVSQHLNKALVQGNCYEFSIHMAKSPIYLSQSRLSEKEVNYNRSIKLRIYGGNTPCDRQQLLAESELVQDYDWKRFTFTLSPKDNFTFIVFEAFYQKPNLFPYNGNILLDNASAIVPITCKEGMAVSGETSALPSDTLSDPNPSIVVTAPELPKFVKGEPLPLKAIKFSTGTSDLQRSGYVTLDKLIETLTLNPTLVVEISVHLSYRYDKTDAEDLSVQRANTIEQYLLDKLVKKSRFKIRGYGNGQPLNAKQLSDADERVEIKIADF
ncbi:OmpA family protein [Haliscomenobacter sp.]|uniref:OmpA family protein n=1 Tax=Haliscomenobacter sp. TaxID=2717303 RepID=UPI003BAA986A